MCSRRVYSISGDVGRADGTGRRRCSVSRSGMRALARETGWLAVLAGSAGARLFLSFAGQKCVYAPKLDRFPVGHICKICRIKYKMPVHVSQIQRAQDADTRIDTN